MKLNIFLRILKSAFPIKAYLHLKKYSGLKQILLREICINWKKHFLRTLKGNGGIHLTLQGKDDELLEIHVTVEEKEKSVDFVYHIQWKRRIDLYNWEEKNLYVDINDTDKLIYLFSAYSLYSLFTSCGSHGEYYSYICNDFKILTSLVDDIIQLKELKQIYY